MRCANESADWFIRTRTPRHRAPSPVSAACAVVFSIAVITVSVSSSPTADHAKANTSNAHRRAMATVPVATDVMEGICPSVGSTQSCLGFLVQERTSEEERLWSFASCGGFHTCGIKDNEERTAQCFGRENEGQSTPPVSGGWTFLSSG
eukprot:3648142-Rhodomonas_salina.1